jgi:twitching motility protein PilT
MNQQNFHALLTLGVKKGASDIHLQAGYPPAYRINGNLYSAKMEPFRPEDTQAAVELVMGERGMADEAEEIDCGYSIAGVSRFRANIYKQRGSFGMVMRVIPFELPTLETLNLPKVISRIADSSQGLILITGATGEGKSTTIAGILNKMNMSEHRHIITVEDPIEFLFPPGQAVVSQREVGRDTKSFKHALRSAMRQDPDVLMVGELRDTETAETCIKAAETGHLVITTLHTMDSMRTINRFAGMFPSEDQMLIRGRLADALRAIVCLRLLPRADGRGLVPACEVLLNSISIQQAIRDPAKAAEIPSLIERSSDDLGTQTFDQHLLQLCRRGVITPEVAKSNATSPSEIERALSLDPHEA